MCVRGREGKISEPVPSAYGNAGDWTQLGKEFKTKRSSKKDKKKRGKFARSSKEARNW